MPRPLGIDNTVIVDVFLNNMTQAQNDLQRQLEHATADLTPRALLNDSLVQYIDTSEPTPSNFIEQMEHTKVEHENPKLPIPPDDTDRTQETPTPPKKRYEIMSFFLHQSILVQSLQKLHFARIVTII